MALFERVQYNFEDVGETVTVPNNATAKLMYYFSVICSLIELDSENELQRLRNYSKYYQLTRNEKQALLEICKALDPTILINKVIFVSEDTGECDNRIIKIGEQRLAVAAVDNIIIGGARQRVTKIMLFRRRWLQTNYYQPLDQLKYELSPPALTNNTTSNTRNYSSGSCSRCGRGYPVDDYCTLWGILCCLCFFPLGIACLFLCKGRKCSSCGANLS